MYGILDQPASETGKSKIIGRKPIEGEPQKLFKGNLVVDLGFEFRIGVDLEQFLEKRVFDESK